MISRIEGFEWKSKHKISKQYVVRWKVLGMTVYKKVFPDITR